MFCYIALVISWKWNIFSNLIWIWRSAIQRMLTKMIPVTGWVHQEVKDNKVKVLEWPSQSHDLNRIENVWAELKKCVRARRSTNLTQLHHLCQKEWAKIHPTYCGKLVEGYLKRWPMLNNLKAMLPNIAWVYVNFWPTGNVMKEIKAEINHSLYYYSDTSHS